MKENTISLLFNQDGTRINSHSCQVLFRIANPIIPRCHMSENIISKNSVLNFLISSFEILILVPLVEHAGKFSMLHQCMHSKFLKNIENTESIHGKIFVKFPCNLQNFLSRSMHI